MKPFRFSLQPLLDQRVRADDDCRRALVAAARDVAAQRGHGARIRQAFAQAAAPSGGCARASTTELSLLSAALDLCERRLRALCAAEDAARTAFAAARRERRRLQALYDREMSAYAAAIERREAAALDEANNASHNASTLSARSLHN